MCDCPAHFDTDASCRCSCDHAVEDAMEYITGLLWDALSNTDPKIVKALAAKLREGDEGTALVPHEWKMTWLDTCAECGQGIENANREIHGWENEGGTV